MRLLAYLIFIPLQIVFIPLAILGVAIVTYRQLFVSKRLGASSTGIEVVQGRWTMHVFGIRRDEPTSRLTSALPNASKLGLWLILFPLWMTHKLTGTRILYPRVPDEGDETLADLVVARTLYFDRMLERVAPDVEQFVVLGAGYDTRAYGELKRDGLRIFEMDQEATQELKRMSLAKAGVASEHVTFVTVDFKGEDAFEKLEQAGYDPTKKSLFLWEGVTLYLREEDVRRTLSDIREHSAVGSSIVADIYGARLIDYASRPSNRKTLEYTNETVTFGLSLETDFEAELETFVGEQGLTVGEAVFMGRNTKKGVLMVVAELCVDTTDASRLP